MSAYIVMSRHMPEEGEPFNFEEVRRTDYNVAKQDVSIIQDILHRKAWIEEKDNGR